MEKKGDISAFELGMDALPIFWDFPTQSFLWFTENGPKRIH